MERKDIAKAFIDIKRLISDESIQWTRLPINNNHGVEIPDTMGYHGEVAGWAFTIAKFKISGTDEPRFDGAVNNTSLGLVMHLPYDLSQLLAEQAEKKAPQKPPQTKSS